MKFAVFSLMQWPEDRSEGDVFANELAQLELAETQGWDAAWLAEHHFSRYGIGPSIHLTAAHLAARTHRIRIGTAVTVLPNRMCSVSPNRSAYSARYPAIWSADG